MRTLIQQAFIKYALLPGKIGGNSIRNNADPVGARDLFVSCCVPNASETERGTQWCMLTIYGMTLPRWQVMRKDPIVLSMRKDTSAETSRGGRREILKFKNRY